MNGPDEANGLRRTQQSDELRHVKSQQGRAILIGGTVALATVGVLAISLRYATDALRSRDALLAIVAMQPLAFFAIWIQGPRLSLLAGPPATAAAAFWANVLSSTVFMITPARISEAVKPIVLTMQTGLPLARGFAAIAVERLLDIGCLAILVGLTLGSVATEYSAEMRGSWVILLVLLLLGFGGISLASSRPKFAESLVRLVPTQRLRHAAIEVLEVLSRAGNWRQLRLPLLLSALSWAASYANWNILLAAIGGIALSPGEVLAVFVIGTLGLVVTVTPGGLGTYEGAIVVALGAFGYPFADALAIAILMRIATILPALPTTVWFLARSSIGLPDLLERLRQGPNLR